jgi:hypothetical protein
MRWKPGYICSQGVEDVSPKELEKAAEDFLREHDPQFLRKNKRAAEYPYLSKRQAFNRYMREIPISNLSNKQRRRSPKLGDSHVYPTY